VWGAEKEKSCAIQTDGNRRSLAPEGQYCEILRLKSNDKAIIILIQLPCQTIIEQWQLILREDRINAHKLINNSLLSSAKTNK